MTGDCHVQFSESARVRFPRATRLNDADFSAIMIKDKHTGFFIFTGDKIRELSRNGQKRQRFYQ